MQSALGLHPGPYFATRRAWRGRRWSRRCGPRTMGQQCQRQDVGRWEIRASSTADLLAPMHCWGCAVDRQQLVFARAVSESELPIIVLAVGRLLRGLPRRGRTAAAVSSAQREGVDAGQGGEEHFGPWPVGGSRRWGVSDLRLWHRSGGRPRRVTSEWSGTLCDREPGAVIILSRCCSRACRRWWSRGLRSSTAWWGLACAAREQARIVHRVGPSRSGRMPGTCVT